MIRFKQLCDISASSVQDLIQPTRMTIHKATHIVYLENTQCGLHRDTNISQFSSMTEYKISFLQS